MNHLYFVIPLFALIIIQYADGVPASSIVTKDALGNEIDPTLNQQVFFNYDIANGDKSSKAFEIDLFIILDDTNEQIFYKKQQLQLKPDAWTTVTWSFTPLKPGNYTAKIIENDISHSYGFVIKNDVLTQHGNNLCDEFSVLKKAMPIELKYEIDAGKITKICKLENDVSVVVKIEADSNGRFSIEIPKKLVYSLLDDCEEGEIFVLMDNAEIIPVDTKSTISNNIMTIEFQKGEHVVEFVGTNMVSQGSKFSPAIYCGIVKGYNLQYLPPKIQIENGVSLQDIRCNKGLELIFKNTNDFPACVKPKSLLRLVDLGWGHIANVFETKTDLLNTKITGGKIIGFKFDVEAASIVINLETTNDGSLTLSIPKALTDSMSWYKNNPSHGALIDGQFLELNEIITSGGTTVIIPFKQGAKTIEIFGSHEHKVTNCPVDESLDLIPVRFDQFGNPLRLVFFVESNSTAQICIRYTSGLDNQGTKSVADKLIVDYFNNQKSHISSDVTSSAEPSSVPLAIGSETFVLFTITAPANSDGVYWLPEGQMCDAIPIVVWSDLPQVNSSELTVIVGFHSCGPQMLTAKIVGFSGAIMDYKPAKPIGYRD
ncbi:MAG: hypothetical protein ACT4N5_05750 [Nitrosopumilaceae archaeon]